VNNNKLCQRAKFCTSSLRGVSNCVKRISKRDACAVSRMHRARFVNAMDSIEKKIQVHLPWTQAHPCSFPHSRLVHTRVFPFNARGDGDSREFKKVCSLEVHSLCRSSVTVLVVSVLFLHPFSSGHAEEAQQWTLEGAGSVR